MSTTNNVTYKNKFIKVIVTYEIEVPKVKAKALENSGGSRLDFGKTDTEILNMFDRDGYHDIEIEYNDEPYYIDGEQS